MTEEDFNRMLQNALEHFTLDFTTNVEYGYDGNGDNVQLTVKLLSPSGTTILETSTTINLPD